MPIKVSFNGTDDILISSIRTRREEVLERLANRLALSMEKLQEKAREKLAEKKSNKYPENPRNPSTGALSDSIENPRAEVAGTTVRGLLDWGQGIPYAKIQEEGGELPPVNPLGARRTIGRALGGTRKHVKGAIRQFGADVLQFMGTEGDFAYAKYAFPGAILGKHFMAEALSESVDEIKAGVKEVLSTGV